MGSSCGLKSEIGRTDLLRIKVIVIALRWQDHAGNLGCWLRVQLWVQPFGFVQTILIQPLVYLSIGHAFFFFLARAEWVQPPALRGKTVGGLY